MNKEEMEIYWANFIDEVASVFHWRYENDVHTFISGLEGDVPLEGLGRLYISKELSKIFKKYELPLHKDLYYTMESILRETPKLANTSQKESTK